MADERKHLTIGSQLSELDIFLNVEGVPINATTVNFAVYDAASVQVTSGTAVNTAVGTYTASGSIPSGFTLGTWEIQWLIWPVGSPIMTAAEHFEVQALTISFGFQPAGEDVTSVFDFVRLDIGDPEGVVFGDEILRRILKKAVTRLNNKLGLGPKNRGPIGVPGQFGGLRVRALPITVDFDTGVVTPEGDEYTDLLCLQMEVIIVTSEISALKRLSASATSGPFITTVGNTDRDGISVTNADGVTINISSVRLTTRASLARFDVEQKEAELEMAVSRYLQRASANYSKLIY